MKVADSSYLIEALLRDASILENEIFIAPDLALYEVVNTLWNHQVKLRDLKDATARIELFIDLTSDQRVQLLMPDAKLLAKAYALSVTHRIPTYDTIFVALALQLGVELKTYDSRQSPIFSQERHT
jgi:predicted nucleic acid-binding protein